MEINYSEISIKKKTHAKHAGN